MSKYPLVFDFHHFSLDDGPGIRTTVFLKGCPLSCVWCHNPEGVSPAAELIYDEARCVACGSCFGVCPHKALQRDPATRVIRSKCVPCDSCSSLCPSNALRTIGEYYSPGAIVDRLLSDRIFYDRSGGGVTFSGGEPTLHMEYLGAVMRTLKDKGIHIALETAGTFNFSEFERRVLPFSDIIYFDLKILDDAKFRQYSGGDSRLIRENFIALNRRFSVKVVATTTLVPRLTATEHNLRAISRLLKKAGCSSWLFRPYHPGGISKRKRLSMQVSDVLPEEPLSITDETSAVMAIRSKHRIDTIKAESLIS